MKVSSLLLFVLFALLSVASAEATDLSTGEKIYQQHCMACHAPSNIMVASPKRGDTQEWSRRLEENKGLQGLVISAMKGKNAMPKKGRCLKCGPKEIESAISYMMKAE